MHLPRPAILAVDAADLGRQDERDLRLTGAGNIVGPMLFLEREQTVAKRVKLLLQLFDPFRVGEITRADDRDALELRLFPDALRAHVRTRGSRIVGMDVKVGDESHPGL